MFRLLRRVTNCIDYVVPVRCYKALNILKLRERGLVQDVFPPPESVLIFKCFWFIGFFLIVCGFLFLQEQAAGISVFIEAECVRWLRPDCREPSHRQLACRCRPAALSEGRPSSHRTGL